MDTTIDEYARGYQAAKVSAVKEIELLKEENAELLILLEQVLNEIYSPDNGGGVSFVTFQKLQDLILKYKN